MRGLRFFGMIFLLALLPMTLHAQDNTPDAAYAEALRRIEAAQVSGTTQLDLSNLGLTELPSEIGQLTHLAVLRLNNNHLTSVPIEIGQLDNLKDLYLQVNRLSTLPLGIGRLDKLQRIWLDSNKLSTLPPEIRQLASLESLSLWDNKLTRLPSEIGYLTNLRELHLGNNQLTSLPPEIGQLTHLCGLEVGRNRIQHLPVELANTFSPANCSSRWLGLANNPLITPPPEVIAEGTPAILAYLRDQARYHTRQLIVSLSGGAGFFAAVILGLRWRYRRSRKPKAKRGEG